MNIMVISYEKFKDYQDKWVAVDIKTEEIVASAEDIASVQARAEKIVKKNQKVVLKYVHRFDRRLAPSSQIISVSISK